MSHSHEKYKKAALLLTEFLDDLLNQKPNILEQDKDMHLNIDKLKDTRFEDLQKQDKIAIALVLLKQLQPYLSASNLSTTMSTMQHSMEPTFKNTGSKFNSHLNTTTDTGFIRSRADDVLKEHGASGTSTDVDALNNILNNVSVQNQFKGIHS